MYQKRNLNLLKRVKKKDYSFQFDTEHLDGLLSFSCFLAGRDFWCLLITFANRLDLVGPDLDPNCLI